jgi:hypothetical protein
MCSSSSSSSGGSHLQSCTLRLSDTTLHHIPGDSNNSMQPLITDWTHPHLPAVCPPGTYESAGVCVPCGTGSYCPGGNKKATGPNDDRGTQNTCGPTGLTTKTAKAAKYSDCVALPGYVLPKNKGDSATQCTGSTYAPANNKLKSCLKCQSGLESPANWPVSVPKTDKNQVCQVPPGRFLETNVIRECPKGLYRENYVLINNKTAISCLSCKPGWTTVTIGTPSRELCNGEWWALPRGSWQCCFAAGLTITASLLLPVCWCGPDQLSTLGFSACFDAEVCFDWRCLLAVLTCPPACCLPLLCSPAARLQVGGCPCRQRDRQRHLAW